MAWEDWENPRTAELWNSVLDVIEQEAQRLSQDQRPDLSISVARSKWDAPDVELSWGSGDLQRNIHVVLQGDRWPLVIALEGAVWQDVATPAGRQRLSRSLRPRTDQARDLQHVKTFIYQDMERVLNDIKSLKPTTAVGATA